MALLRADILTNIQYIILIILINMINQQTLNNLDNKVLPITMLFQKILYLLLQLHSY
jgi:hypothetical protein